MNAHEGLVLAVAKAIWNAEHKVADWDGDAGPSAHETAMAMTKARAALGEVIKALETVTPEMVDAWEKADWIPEGKSFSDFTDEEASRLCCAANFAAILGASPLMKGQ